MSSLPHWLSNVGRPDEIAGSSDLLLKPGGRDVESVGPCRRAKLKKHAFEIVGIAQRLDHRAGLVHDFRKIILADGTVCESKPQTMIPNPLNLQDLDHHPDPLFARAAAGHARAPNSPAGRPDGRVSIA